MKWPILLWMIIFGVCCVAGYLADIGWMMVVGGIGVVFYIFVWRSSVTTLHLAIEHMESHDVLKLIHKEGADIEAKDVDGNTPLHIASRCNRYEIAKMLIDKDVDVDVKNNMGNTPLHWAAVSNSCETAKLLISSGADINLKNKQGLTPPDVAEAKGHFNLTQILR